MNENPERLPAELPPRRLNVTQALEWGEVRWVLSVGFDRQGAAREVFIDPGEERPGAVFGLTPAVVATAHDLCIALSHLYQRSETAAQLAARLRPANPAIASRSFVWAIADAVAEVERESTAVAEAYAARHRASLGGQP